MLLATTTKDNTTWRRAASLLAVAALVITGFTVASPARADEPSPAPETVTVPDDLGESSEPTPSDDPTPEPLPEEDADDTEAPEFTPGPTAFGGLSDGGGPQAFSDEGETGSISGQVSPPVGFADENWWQAVRVSVSSDEFFELVSLESDGTYTITDLAPGQYTIYFSVGTYYDYASSAYVPVNLISEYFDNQHSWDDSESVSVFPGATTTANASLDAGGTITGQVSPLGSLDDSNWWKGVQVVAESEASSAIAYLEPDGSYTMTGMRPGEYIIEFRASSYYDNENHIDIPVNLISEFYNNASDREDASPVVVTTGSSTTASATLASGATITGHVSAPEGVADLNWWKAVQVVAYGDGSSAFANVDADGNYAVVGLDPGEYTVQFSVGTYYDVASGTSVPVNLVSEYYDDALTWEDAFLVEVTEGGNANADAALAIGGIITGNVSPPAGFEDDDPDWWRAVTVHAYTNDSSGSAPIDEDGNYVIVGLVPGEYRIQFYVGTWYDDYRDDIRVNLISEYYDDVLNWEDAYLVEVTAGDTFTANAELGSGGSITGTVTPPPGFADDNWWQAVEVFADSDDHGGYTRLDEDGKYTIDGLAPGEYVLQFRVGEYYDDFDNEVRVNLISEYYDNQTNWDDADRVNVAVGATVTADAELDAGGTITGTVTAPSESNPDWWKAVGVVAEADHGWGYAHLDEDGTYTISGLASDNYVVRFEVGSYWDEGVMDDVQVNLVSEYYNNQTSWGAADRIAVSVGETEFANATLEPGGTITGRVSAPDDFEDDNWWQAVYVNASGEDDSRGTRIAADGTYTIVGLASGTYKVQFSAEDYWDELTDEYIWVDLVSEYYDNTYSWFQAAPVAVTVGASTPGIDATLERGLSISGTIELPLDAPPEWLQSLYMYVDAQEGWVDSRSHIDRETGEYTIWGLAPTVYDITVMVEEYWDEDTEDWVNPNLVGTVLQGIDVSTGDREDVNILLEYGLTITGTITLPADVNPDVLQAITVSAQRSTGGPSSWGSATADAGTGTYTIVGLAPGDYVVHAQLNPWSLTDPDDATSIPNILAEYYQNKSTAAEADLVTVTSPGKAGVDFELDLGWSLGGQVSGLGDSDYQVQVTTLDGKPVYSEGSITWLEAGENSFHFWSLPPGAYRVLATGWSEEGGSSQQYLQDAEGNTQWAGGTADHVDVNLIARATTASIEGTLTTSGFTGHTVDPGYWNRDYLADVYLYENLSGEWVKYPHAVDTAFVDNGATPYSIPGLGAGSYKVGFGASQTPFTLNGPISQEWYNGKDTLAAADVITLATGTNETGINGHVSPRGSGGELVNTGAPSISGTAATGGLLTAATGSWNETPDSFTYQWLRNGADIGGATKATYTPVAGDVSAQISVRVTAVKAGYTSASQTSAHVTVVQGSLAPVNPTITGTPAVGSQLTAVPGSWSPAPVAFTYQWLRAGVAIDGATAVKYTPTSADVGQAISVRVTGNKAGFAEAIRTSGTVAVAGQFTTAPTPSIVGGNTSGSVLSVTLGTWVPEPTSFAYQWLRDGKVISGATGATYTVATADRGTSLTVRVTASRAAFPSVVRTSAAKAIPLVFSKTPVPTVSGATTVGSTLTAKAGTWTPKPTLTYQWLRDGSVISGATKTTYKLVAADRGTKVTVRVTGTKTGYLTTSTTSAAKSIPQVFAKAPAPTIVGGNTSGSTLSVNLTGWDPAPSAKYQWLRNGKAISKATKSTYKVTTKDRGTKITVKITASKSGYIAVTKTSAAKVIPKVFTKAPTPKFSGGNTSGSTLTATPGTWTPKAKLKYQWLRNGTPIKGATKAKYKLVAADRGTQVTVRVTGSKSGYLTTAKTSKAKSIPKVFAKAPTPLIVGGNTSGSTLSVSFAGWDPAPSAKYQWLRNGKAISKATKSTYKVTTKDRGTKITVKITASKSGYVTVTKTSKALTIPKVFTKAPVPTVSGKTSVGSTLTVKAGTWAPKATLKYQWLRNGVPIAGATAAKYTVTLDDAGTTLTVTITGSASGHLTTVKTSAPKAIP